MAVDIYLKIPNDPNYLSGEIEVEDDLFNFVQYIEMILTTNKGEIFGAPSLGANLEAYLWNPNITKATIKNEIMLQIYDYCDELCSRITFDIDVNFIKGQLTDSIIVDIEIDGKQVLGIVASPK